MRHLDVSYEEYTESYQENDNENNEDGFNRRYFLEGIVEHMIGDIMGILWSNYTEEVEIYKKVSESPVFIGASETFAGKYPTSRTSETR